MRKLSLLLLACLTLGIAWAERVSVNTAQQVAANVAAGLSPSNLRSSSDLKLVYAAPAKQQSGLRSADNESDYYIFNVGTGDGFIIVAGEDRVRPVLGYSAEGEVDMEKMPENMKAWLAGYQEEISWVAEQNISASDAIQKEWQEWLSGSKSMANQGVLLETAKWDQGDPYNRMTPTIGDQHTLTGCVATAMAIIMEYHQFPDKPVVASSEVSYTVNGEPRTETIPYADTHYDWNVMSNIDYNSGNVSFADADAVAELMWHCGANAHMNYGLTASGAAFIDAMQAFRNIFGYKASRHIDKMDFTWSEWINLVKNELNNDRPVYYDGQNQSTDEGHAFICDGYTQDDYFHINWGWGYRNPAYYNDYYLLTCLDAEGTNYNFSRDCGMMLDVYPTDEQPITELRFQSLECSLLPLEVDKSFTISCGVKNVGGTFFDGSIGIGVVGSDGSVKNVLAQWENMKLPEGNYYTSPLDFECNLPFILVGGEMIVPIYKMATGEWTAMEGVEGVPAGIDMNGYVEKEEEEKPAITVEWLSNPYDGKYVQVGHSLQEDKPIQIKWNGANGGTIEIALKNPEWADALELSYKTEYGNGGSLSFNEDGKATIQTGTDENGMMEIYLTWNVKEYISETIEYELRAWDTTSISPTYTINVIEEPLTWVYPETNIKGVRNQELPFTIKATNVPSRANNKDVSIRLFIEAVFLGEVEVYYVNDEGKRTKLNIIINPELSYDGFLLTEDFTVNLVEGKEYKFIYRYIGDRSFTGTTVYVDAVSQNGAEIPIWNSEEDGTLGAIVFEISTDTIVVTKDEPITYNEEHKVCNVIVENGATYIIPENATDATIANLSVYDGGQIEAHQPLTVTGSTMVFLDIPTGKWRTLTMPLDTWMREDASGIYLKTGFRFVDEQEWKLETPNSGTGQYAVSQGSVHLAASDPAKEDVIFEWAAQNTPYTVEVPKNTAVYGNEENGNWFHFVANPNWQNLLVNGKAYVLNDAGNSFELQQSPVIPPFQAYMIASEAVMKQVSSLRIGDIPTSNEDLAVTGFRVWSESGHVCFETTEAKDVAVYSMNGVQQCRFERSVGVHRQQLPQGIYIVVCDGTAYKVSVK